jgi:Contractile injection system tube protein
MSDPVSYLRGAFIAYEPGGYPNGDKRVIPFRFNPETLSRGFQIDQGKSGSGTEGAKKGKGGSSQSPDAASGTVKQTFTVQVRFDFDDRSEAANNLPAELGIYPELSALEGLLYPAAAPTDASSDGKEPVKARQQRPTVLFVWGKKRVLPVRITGMTINETRHNTDLAPLRAEVDVQLEVMLDSDAKDNKAVADALAYTGSKRDDMAKQFLNATASQGTTILPL